MPLFKVDSWLGFYRNDMSTELRYNTVMLLYL